ncbi:MAG: N,N-dimethylformamidase beta subunit family domain-containing protein [Geodermatophilaceae bacterium]
MSKARRGVHPFVAGLVCLAVAALVPAVLTTSAAQAAPGPCDPGRNPVVCENSKPGSPQSDWMVGSTYGDIAGYGTSASVRAGDVLPFKVRTPSTSWHIEIYRLGWYGGDGARRMGTVNPAVPLPQNQPACINQSTTGLVDCGNWAVSATWPVPGNAVSGLYVANFLRDDGFGVNQFPFVVRDDASTSDIAVQTSDQTWQAYNTYGGNSLYTGSFSGSSDGRAYKVSYNRPYLNSGVQNFQNDELPMVRWIERNGYDVSYLSSVDTSRNPALLLNHKTFVSSGHDEYWNGPQRAGVEQAREAGMNLAFFSGNEMFWKTRFEPSIDGTNTAYRTMVCYKETKAGTKIDPSTEWTGTWRDPRLSPPSDGGRPENAVTGTLFRVNAYAEDTITVPWRYASMRLWRNSDIANLQQGQTASLTRNSLGFEWDEFPDNGFRPPGAVAMSETTVSYNSGSWVLLDYGNTYGTGTVRHSLALHRDQSSGALVFGAGTVQWAWGLDDLHEFPGPAVDRRMQQATVNLLADMGAQPQTLQAGLVAATKSTDSSGPTTTITAPTAGSSIPLGSNAVIAGTATDSGGQVAGVEVSVDGGSSWRMAKPGANGKFTSWTYPWTPTAQGPVTIRVRSSDDSANIGAAATVSVTVSPQACPCTLFGGTTPSVLDSGDVSPYELGVRFQTSVTSSVTGVRFYKATANSGSHTGSLWTSGGVRLATGTFTAESASGWQTLTFANPVPISAGTTYVASYTTTKGHYSVTSGYFTGKGAGAPPLTAPASTSAARQGVFTNGSGFPTASFGDSNYWVDVTVTTGQGDTVPPSVTSRRPKPGARGVGLSANVVAFFNEPVRASSLSFAVNGVAATVTLSADRLKVTLNPTSNLTAATTYTATLRATDDAGNAMPAPLTWTFSTAAG